MSCAPKRQYICIIFFLISAISVFFTFFNADLTRNYPACSPSIIMPRGEEAYVRTVNMTLNVRKVLDSAGIWNVAVYGTLLSAIRHGTQTPWDDDVDFAVKLADVDKILSLRSQFRALGYEVDVIYRLIKITEVPKCFVEGTCEQQYAYRYGDKLYTRGVNYRSPNKVWADLFVVNSTCGADVAARMGLFHQATGWVSAQPPNCRCYCYGSENLVTVAKPGFLAPSEWESCVTGGVRGGTPGSLPMPGLCAPLSAEASTQSEFFPERMQLPFAGDFIWGFSDSEAALEAYYGATWWQWLGNSGSHNIGGNKGICRFYEKSVADHALSLFPHQNVSRSREVIEQAY